MLIGSRSKSPLIFCMLFPAMETTYRSLTECVCDEGSNPAKATRRPSGETTGFDYAPGLVTRSWIVPVATSTRYNCEVSRGICTPMRSACGLRSALKTIDLLSGVQSMVAATRSSPEPTLHLPLVSCFGVPPSDDKQMHESMVEHS